MKAALRTQLRTTRDGPKRCGPRNLSNDHRDVDRSATRTCETAYCNGPPNVTYSQIRPWYSIGGDGGLSPDSCVPSECRRRKSWAASGSQYALIEGFSLRWSWGARYARARRTRAVDRCRG